MIEERPYLQIPLPSEHDWRLYEEWLRQKEEQQDKEKDNDRPIIIVDP